MGSGVSVGRAVGKAGEAVRVGRARRVAVGASGEVVTCGVAEVQAASSKVRRNRRFMQGGIIDPDLHGFNR